MPSSSQWKEILGNTVSRWASKMPSRCSVNWRKLSLLQRISSVARSKTIMGRGVKSILLERAESMPP